MPSIEPMLITRAGSSRLAAARSGPSNAAVRWKVPSTFVCTTRSQPEAGNSSSGAPQVVPALFTRMFSFPKRAVVASASAAAPSGVETSPGIPSQSPSSASSRAASATGPSLREEMITRAPACTSPRAIMKPIPREPPVTSAVFPETSKSSLIALVGELSRSLLEERGDRLGRRDAERGHDLLAVLVLDGGLLGGNLERRPGALLGQPHAPGRERGDLLGGCERTPGQRVVLDDVGEEPD